MHRKRMTHFISYLQYAMQHFLCFVFDTVFTFMHWGNACVWQGDVVKKGYMMPALRQVSHQAKKDPTLLLGMMICEPRNPTGAPRWRQCPAERRRERIPWDRPEILKKDSEAAHCFCGGNGSSSSHKSPGLGGSHRGTSGHQCREAFHPCP